MSIRKISTQEFLKLDFKVKSPEYFYFDCADRLDLGFLAYLTLATNCGIEIKFKKFFLSVDSYDRENNVYLYVEGNMQPNVTENYYLGLHSRPYITLKGCVFLDKQVGSTNLDAVGDEEVSFDYSDEIFLAVLEKVLRKTPWKFGVLRDIERDISSEWDEWVAISKMDQVDRDLQDRIEAELEAHVYQGY